MLVDSVFPHLPEDKPRLYQGACDPIMILDLVQAGVDIFESSYAHMVTEKGWALVFKNTLEKVNEVKYKIIFN